MDPQFPSCACITLVWAGSCCLTVRQISHQLGMCVRGKIGNPSSGSGDHSQTESEPRRLQEKSRIKTQGGKNITGYLLREMLLQLSRLRALVKQILANAGQI